MILDFPNRKPICDRKSVRDQPIAQRLEALTRRLLALGPDIAELGLLWMETYIEVAESKAAIKKGGA